MKKKGGKWHRCRLKASDNGHRWKARSGGREGTNAFPSPPTPISLLICVQTFKDDVYVSLLSGCFLDDLTCGDCPGSCGSGHPANLAVEEDWLPLHCR
jgi:hypothetical protein